MSDSKKTISSKKLQHAKVITESRYNFNVIEKRCYYLVLEELRKKHSNVSKNLFDDLVVKMPHFHLEKAGDKHRKVYKSLETLRDKTIHIEDKNKKMTVGFINYVEYDKNSRTYEVGISHKILPYLLDLVTHVYTSFDMVIVMSLKSEYTQRFYELCSQYRKLGKFFKSEEELRAMFKLENKYKSTYDFKKHTIIKAQNELKKLYDAGQSDICFTFRPKEKEGKRELSWWFDIHDKKKVVGDLEYEDLHILGQQVKLALNRYFPKDKKYVKRVIDDIMLNPDKIPEVAKKLERTAKNYSNNTAIAKIARTFLRDDFNIE